MLTKRMKKLLDYMRKHEPDLQDRFYDVSNLALHCQLDEKETWEVCRSLDLEHYVSFADKYQTCVSLLEKGRGYKELRSQETFQFLRRSVLVPILVSLITAVITTFIIK